MAPGRAPLALVLASLARSAAEALPAAAAAEVPAVAEGACSCCCKTATGLDPEPTWTCSASEFHCNQQYGQCVDTRACEKGGDAPVAEGLPAAAAAEVPAVIEGECNCCCQTAAGLDP